MPVIEPSSDNAPTRIVARTLAVTLLDRMERPFTPPVAHSATDAERQAWLSGYKHGLAQARVEIGCQVADEMRDAR